MLQISNEQGIEECTVMLMCTGCHLIDRRRTHRLCAGLVLSRGKTGAVWDGVGEGDVRAAGLRWEGGTNTCSFVEVALKICSDGDRTCTRTWNNSRDEICPGAPGVLK